MCLILDTNRIVDVLGNSHAPKYKRLRDAILGSPRRARLVLGGELSREYLDLRTYLRLFQELERAGAIRRIPDNDVDAEEDRVVKLGICASDDPHIIALARVGHCRLLCTEDRKLIEDFGNPKLLSRPRGRIYTPKQHRTLIDSACRSCISTSRSRR